MDYTLVLQLKEAGFPIKEIVGSTINILPVYYGPILKEPSLSELIEACEDRFDRLERGVFRGGEIIWSVFDTNDNESMGKTPEIAVADLYLSLHKK